MESTNEEGLKDLLREIDLAEKKCLDTLIKLRRQRLELTGDDIIDFKISTIHKDRRFIVIDKILSVDRDATFKKLKEEWNYSVKSEKGGVLLGTVTGSGPKAKFLSVMHKIVREGATISITSDNASDIKIPPPQKWWYYDEDED